MKITAPTAALQWMRKVIIMSEILSSKIVTTRTPHDCFGCGRKFPVGTAMQHEGIKDGSSVFTAYLCDSCCAIQGTFSLGDEFGFGELLDDVLEYEATHRKEADYVELRKVRD